MSLLAYDLQANATIVRDLGPVRDRGYRVQQDECLQVPNNSAVNGGAPFVPAIAVFTKEKPKQAVIAIKGTTLTSLSDVLADVVEVVGGVYPTEGVERVAALMDKYSRMGYAVLVTGHSLGGYLAEVVSTHYNLPGAAFCSPGPNNALTGTGHDGPYKNPNFHNINAQHDPIGNANVLLWQHRQWTIYVAGKERQWQAHLMRTMYSWLESVPRIRDITNVNVLSYVHTNPITHQYYLPDPRG